MITPALIIHRILEEYGTPALPSRRVVCWFSHGIASAVATKIALSTYTEVTIACIDTGSEHPDNERFRADCERWFGQPVVMLSSPDFTDIWDVFDGTGYLVGPGGARCTTELKKKVRWAFQRYNDLQVFGYTVDTRDFKRAQRFNDQNPEIDTWFPLIARNLTKVDCYQLVSRAGIEPPMMYRLGYQNNNCVGCVKGGMGYWNKIRVDFPVVFKRMSEQERKMGRTVLREKGQPLYLDTLDPDRGNYKAEYRGSCDLDCQLTEKEWLNDR